MREWELCTKFNNYLKMLYICVCKLRLIKVKAMKIIKSTSILIFSLSILLILNSCEKWRNNLPSISFIEPHNNLVIDQDTILTITLDAYDEDGTIKKVELLMNGTVVKTFDSQPYQYEWHISKFDDQGLYNIKAIATDNKKATSEAEISVEVRDYRTKYIGSFYFETITQRWSINKQTAEKDLYYSTSYDTSYYNGMVSIYKSIDSESDLYVYDDSNENKNEKITIEFGTNTIITSLLNSDGSLVPKTGYHYSHQGGYAGFDTIKFTVNGLGGLGGGINYRVFGVRKY